MKTFDIIKIKLRVSRNQLKSYRKANKQSVIRAVFFGSLALLFLIGVYALFYRILSHFNDVPIFGPILIMRLLAMVFLTFLSMLIFSNIVISISTIYLSDDIGSLMAMPLTYKSIFTVKFFETLISSSWMVVLLGLPIWSAYAAVSKAGIFFIPLATIIIIPFLVISACIGVFFTMVLMRFFPAQKAREIFILLSIGFISIITILFRIIPPSKLTKPDEFIEVMQYISTLKAPIAPYLPSYWASEALLSALYKRWDKLLLYAGILISSSIIAFNLVIIFARKVFYLGWCNASYSHEIGRKHGFFDTINFGRIFSFVKPKEKAFLIKDIKIFRRDTAQWPQLLLLISIIIIYLFNVHHMSLQTLPLTSYALFL